MFLVGRAGIWLRKYNDEYEKLINTQALADWHYETNITDENAAKVSRAHASSLNFKHAHPCMGIGGVLVSRHFIHFLCLSNSLDLSFVKVHQQVFGVI